MKSSLKLRFFYFTSFDASVYEIVFLGLIKNGPTSLARLALGIRRIFECVSRIP